MKSTVVSLPQLSQLTLSDNLLKVERQDYDQIIKNDLEKLQRQYAKDLFRKEGEDIRLGDVVELSIESDKPGSPQKFNREQVSLKIGKNFYDKTLEAALIGKQVGKDYQMVAGDLGQFSVHLTVRSAKYMDLQPLTDEIIQKEEIPGVSTLSEYQADLLTSLQENDELDHIYTRVLPEISQDLIEQASFVIDQEELDRFVGECLANDQEAASYEESPVDFNTYAAEVTGLSVDDQDLEEAMKATYQREFYLNLLYMAWGKPLVQATEEAYKAELDNSRAFGVDEATLKQLTYEKFLENSWMERGREAFFQALRQQFSH